MIAPCLARFIVHALLDHDPFAVVGDDEAVEIKIEPILDGGAIDLCHEAARGRECRAVYSAATAELMPGVEHRSHKGSNNRAENSHLAVRRREQRMMRFKCARQCQRFVSTQGQIANLFLLHRKYWSAADHRQLRTHAISNWREIALPIHA
jgi:hypothetical protein